MKLIADGGSSKTAWALIDESARKVIDEFKTPGLNPSISDEDGIRRNLNEGLRQRLEGVRVDSVEYYGAGCVGEGSRRLTEVLKEIFEGAEVRVDSDLVGACKAMYGDGEGLGVILGTGSNSGYYCRGEIVKGVKSLGYVLGDEGSGTSLGRRLIRGVFRETLPPSVIEDFKATTGVRDYAELVERVYRREAANRFIASSVPVLVRHLSEPSVAKIVEESFDEMYQNVIGLYSEEERTRVGFTGSIAVVFEGELRRVMTRHGVDETFVLADPIKGMIEAETNKHDA